MPVEESLHVFPLSPTVVPVQRFSQQIEPLDIILCTVPNEVFVVALCRGMRLRGGLIEPPRSIVVEVVPNATWRERASDVMASPNPLACTRPGASPQTDDAACLRPLGRLSDTRGGHSENLPVRPSSSEGTRRKTTRAASVAAVVAILLGNLACGSNRGQQPDDADAHLKRGVDLGLKGTLTGRQPNSAR